jgi:predicted alpha-1,2-mannosidase
LSLAASLTVAILIAGSSCGGARKAKDESVLLPVDLVYPEIDAANSRWFFFSSASRPFGMVNLSPDMLTSGTWGTGYRYHSDTIRCFSHIHAWQLSGIPVLPTTGRFKGHLGSDVYGSRYSHKTETIRPGYHRIFLADYGIDAELTSSTRVGFHRYTFPAADESHILFDFTTSLGPSTTEKGFVKKISDRELEGYAVMGATSRRPKPVTVFFVAVFDKPFAAFSGWQNGKLVNTGDVVDGSKTGAYVTFPTVKGEQRLMKVAISYVSAEQARRNLQAEIPHWNFDRVVKESAVEWNRMLGRIEVEGGTHDERRRFYTDLWKALQGRRIVSDVNGQYCDMTGPERRVGQIPLDANGQPKFNQYNSDSFWGAQWTLNTLWHLVYPEITQSFVNSLLQMYSDGGLIPRGPSGGNYTFVMTGATTTPFIVSAWMKGIRNFDVEKAYEGMRKNHLPGGLMAKAGYEHTTAVGGGIDAYIKYGYVPYPLSDKRYGLHQDGAAQTLEYAYQDFALAQMAKALGRMEDYRLFRERAENYRNVWNPDIGWMWVRNREGQWRKPVDILAYENGWVEGNAAQYTWFVPHDVAGLIALMGGERSFTDKLNTCFESALKHGFVSGESHDAETLRQNREVYINYGNQPSIQTAFLFNYSGSPWLTQYWSRKVVRAVYSGLSPDAGYSGDEDQGLMGSLAVLMKIGIFSVNGGTAIQPVYERGGPVFDRVTIHLNKDYYPGEKIVIEAQNNAPENYYIQAATWNGAAWQKPWIKHDVFVKGGTLKLAMGAKPNKDWGSAPASAPPSMSTMNAEE